MNVLLGETLALFGGALTLRTETFAALRARSDVFYRGFIAVVIVGLIVGAFGALAEWSASAGAASGEAAVQQALQGFESGYNGPPEMKAMIAAYIREGVAMGYEITHLPPRAGEGARLLVVCLQWLGQTLAAPFTQNFMGWVLLAGLVVHLTSRWLGGRAGLAEMLGLTALAFTPHLLDALSNLLTLLGNLSGSSTFSSGNSWIGFVVWVWGTAIFVKATAVAQNFSIGRAIGAVALAWALVGAVVVLAILVLALAAGALVAGLSASAR